MVYSNRGLSSSRPQQKTQQQQRSQQQNSMPPPAGAGNQAPVVFDPRKQKLFEKFSAKFGIDPDLLVATMKSTCFRGQRADSPPITNEQLAMLLIVADQYNLNPFTKEIFAYPDKAGGIVAVVSVDGWIRIINEHEQFNGMAIAESEAVITDSSDRKFKHKPCFEWMECTIYRKDREHHQPIKEYFDEVYRPSLNVKSPDGSWYEVQTPWQTHTKRLMRHKTIIQSGRVTFGFAGIYDEEEAQRILDDDRVVSTQAPGDARPATHTEAAADALRRRSQNTEAPKRADPTAEPKAAATTAQRQPRQEETRTAPATSGAGKRPEPWDEPAAQPEDPPARSWPTVEDKERWVSLIVKETSAEGLKNIWDGYLNALDEEGLSETDLDIEAQYQIRAEQLEEQGQ